jgi:hypothetical protein
MSLGLFPSQVYLQEVKNTLSVEDIAKKEARQPAKTKCLEGITKWTDAFT